MTDHHEKNPPLRAARQTLRSFLAILPILLGVLLLASLLVQMLPMLLEMGLFGIHQGLDAVAGAAVGGIFSGHPLVSYLLGGELREGGAGLVGITALVVAWVTVGLVHLPMEAAVFGWRFAVARNLLAFLSAILIAFIIGGLVGGP